MTTHVVPIISVLDDEGTMYINVVRNHGTDTEATYRAMLDRLEFTTTHAAEQVAEFVRGMLADAFHAGREESEAEESSVSELQERNDRQTTRINQQVEEVQQSHARIAELTQELEQVREGSRESLTLCGQARDELRQQLNEANARIEDQSNTIREWMAAVTDREQQIVAREAERDALAESLEQLQSMSDDERVAQAAQRISNLESAVLQHEQRVEGYTQRITHLQGEIDRWRSEVDELGEFSLEFANRKGYCSDWEDFVDEANGRFRYVQLPRRTKDWRFVVSVNVGMTGVPRDEEGDRASAIAQSVERLLSRSGDFAVYSVDYDDLEEDES